ncbi:MAG TPA: phosphatidylglycerophosphatase A [Pyrinomonadaceae bacterium]|nr:phosphatidylglycerophosphatase A [Pyrinomonadaceae bacterium]
MAIKESSDELNPTVDAPGVVPPAVPARTARDYLALAIATCGVGFIPLAPGTFGSVVGIALWVGVRGGVLAVLWSLAGRNNLNLLHISYGLVASELVAVVLITLAGTWAGGRVEKLHGAKDPRKVVIDEVAGQFIALIAVPIQLENWWTIVTAFLLFRFFDIVKPYPARRFENLHGGLGIMADDVVAGIYAAIGVAVAVTVHSFI